MKLCYYQFLDFRQGVRENLMKGQGVRVHIKVKNHCSIRYALCSSTLLYSNRKRNCLPCFPLSSPNEVQCILYKVLWVLKLCQGKTQQSFTGDEDSFLSELNEDACLSAAVPLNHGEACRIDAIATSATTGRNASARATVPQANRQTWKPRFNSLRILLRRAGSYHLQHLRWRLLLLRPLILLRSCGKIIGRGFSPLRELMLFQMTERLRFSSPTSRRRCRSCFQTLLHKNTAEGNQRSCYGSDRGVHEGTIWSNAFRHPVTFQVLDYHATSTQGVHSGVGCTHTSSSGYVRFRFRYRPFGRSVTYPLHLLNKVV